MSTFRLAPDDALIIVEVQNDFLPGGTLSVPEGDEVIAPLNRYIALFARQGLPVYATRDWHPARHCSFKSSGGIWPSHCVAGSHGAEFSAALKLPGNTSVISKATEADKEAYSSFEGTDLAERLRCSRSARLFVGGLGTEYCVLDTVIDALRKNFRVVLLLDAIRALELHHGDGQAALKEMMMRGAQPLTLADIEEDMMPHDLVSQMPVA